MVISTIHSHNYQEQWYLYSPYDIKSSSNFYKKKKNKKEKKKIQEVPVALLSWVSQTLFIWFVF